VDARHSKLDAIASAGALAGLVGVAQGLRVADPLAGFVITVLIVHIGIDATRDVASRLMDANDESLMEAVRAAALSVPSVRDVGDVRVRWLGRQAEVRMIVRLAATLPLTKAHDVAHQVHDTVLRDVPDIREAMVEPAPLPTETPSRSMGSP
jgi:cation diffusion facilitator family transporter